MHDYHASLSTCKAFSDGVRLRDATMIPARRIFDIACSNGFEGRHHASKIMVSHLANGTFPILAPCRSIPRKGACRDSL